LSRYIIGFIPFVFIGVGWAKSLSQNGAAPLAQTYENPRNWNFFVDAKPLETRRLNSKIVLDLFCPILAEKAPK
jgi:hypothetical protein